jgi:hypothetical protein
MNEIKIWTESGAKYTQWQKCSVEVYNTQIVQLMYCLEKNEKLKVFMLQYIRVAICNYTTSADEEAKCKSKDVQHLWSSG